ncbi:LacI family DNA-binding transcriptional regulator [Nesterenkonia sp.]|uniref:LacI family DNA-binding transcriptional regulator n=1 Tax=Nesterenkonia sp. TaxID=704201 RepID=UPI002633066A|nr:LacI family DNA-binding transcriptional regulator [Nesterenkonia sp.]
MASLLQVARLAGVSSATASRALSGRGHVSEGTRQKVIQAAAELGYVVPAAASSLASGRSRSVGVMMPDLHRWFFNTVLTGISETLSRAGYDLTLYNVADDAAVRREIFGSFLHRRRVDAVIAVALELDEWEIQQLLTLGLPVILLGGEQRGVDGMAIDDRAVTQLAAEHLLQLGHRRIGYIGGDEIFDRDYHVPTRRREGFDAALRAWGAEPCEDLVRHADFTIEGGYAAAKQLLGTPGSGLTGLVAASDEMALGALLAAGDLGVRVPEQLSVVGVDGHELGELLGLTTVDQHPLGQGRRAAERVLHRLESGHDDGPADLPFELVVRRSTAALPQTRPAE